MANEQQKQAIENTEGPLLVIAGPGTGKTYTLVQRTLHLIRDKKVSPEQIMVVTFTNKAAKELVTRISNELLRNNIDVNITEMRVGTFHDVFGRILSENIDYTRLQKNHVLLDEYTRRDFVFEHRDEFKKLPHYNALTECRWKKWKISGGNWMHVALTERELAGAIGEMVDKYREELVSVDDMKKSSEDEVLATAEIISKYEELMIKYNVLDFSGILVETYRMFEDHPEVLEILSEKYRYLMVDEYQDTNHIQEQIMIKLAGASGNLCVVGDDDQSLYRFRGATIGNILSFPELFPGKNQPPVKLELNYRSTADIIDFYNNWMDDTNAAGGAKLCGFTWGKARFKKTIQRAPQPGDSDPKPRSVVRLTGADEDQWHEKIYRMITDLKTNGQISDYNQVAFLTAATIKDGEPTYLKLIDYLETRDVPVYGPRFGMFFLRKEIKEIIGCLLLTYPSFMQRVRDGKIVYFPQTTKDYYEECEEYAKKITDGTPLGKWVTDKAKELADLKKDAHYGLSDMVYQMLAFVPFSDYVETNNTGLHLGSVVRERAARNIAHLIDMTSYFETSNKMTDGFKPMFYKSNLDNFFQWYLRNRKDERIDEFEDDSEYAPRGCVSFMTIYQSKGMEFPVTIVDLPEYEPYRKKDVLTNDFIKPYMKGKVVEKEEWIKFYDFWRLYYTAFSRAENLLALTVNRAKITEANSFQFEAILKTLPEFDPSTFAGQVFESISDVNLKNVYSFTSHLGFYDTCPRQYYFFKKLGFTPVRTGNTLFGTLVHETIEDINRAAIEGRIADITPGNIEKWFEANHRTLQMKEHIRLSDADKKNACEQAKRYADYASKDWSLIKETEVEVTDVKPDYILLGKVDLVQGAGNTYELVDFKTGDKPDADDNSVQLRHYKEQLITYSHLIAQRTGKTISKAHLHYTKVKTGDPRITVDVTEEGIKETLDRFDLIVHRIENNDFDGYACDRRTCDNCDIRHYCKTDPKSPVNATKNNSKKTK